MSHDIFFLSFDEPNADAHWAALRARFPRARRLHGVPGLWRAHAACAERSGQDYFYVVDGDNLVNDAFDFSFEVSPAEPAAVRVWRCRNAVNDLVYGYGAIKLYARSAFGQVPAAGAVVDVATSTRLPYLIMPEVASVTVFNGSPYHAWRGAFRECAKLAASVIPGQPMRETAERLDAWCTRGADRVFGESCLEGARAGRAFGLEHREAPASLALINDFTWLKERYEQRRAS